MSHTGIAVSETSVLHMVVSLAREHKKSIEAWAEDRLVSVTYDNINIAFNAPEPTQKNQLQFWNATSATFLHLYETPSSVLQVSNEL